MLSTSTIFGEHERSDPSWVNSAMPANNPFRINRVSKPWSATTMNSKCSFTSLPCDENLFLREEKRTFRLN